MSQATANNNLGFTPGKLAVIAVLSIAFVGLLIYQLSSSGSASVVLKKRVPREANQPSAASSTLAEVAIPAAASDGKWPEVTLEEALEFDPFAFPIALANQRATAVETGPLLQTAQSEESAKTLATNPPESATGKTGALPTQAKAESRALAAKRRLQEEQAVANELRRRGVGVILQTSNGAVARIGELEVRVGDVLNGLRVAEIDRDGIRLVADPESLEAPAP